MSLELDKKFYWGTFPFLEISTLKPGEVAEAIGLALQSDRWQTDKIHKKSYTNILDSSIFEWHGAPLKISQIISNLDLD